jgi:hypothetical protein
MLFPNEEIHGRLAYTFMFSVVRILLARYVGCYLLGKGTHVAYAV